MAPTEIAPSKAEILAKNRAEYDVAADPYWRLTVYEPTHGGWWFSSIGGRRVLDAIGHLAKLGPDQDALEICCGLGDACRYVSRRFGCRTTGADINAQQIDLARANASGNGQDSDVPSLFLRADVQSWTPPTIYQAIFGLDALMLIEDRRRVLATARQTLSPGGRLLLAEVFAGPAYTAEVRDFIWNQDGILNLPTAERQAGQLERLGFEDIHRIEWTTLAVDCFTRMEDQALYHADLLIADKGQSRFDRWVDHARIYRQYFETGALVYELVAARTPQAPALKTAI